MSELEVEISSIKSEVNTNTELSEQNRKRLTNTDSSLGSICSMMDKLLGTGGLTAKSCCYVSHTNSVIGNYMTCLSDIALTAANFFSPGTTGACDTSTDSCGGLAPEL